MKHCPCWEANGSSASQEIPHTLWQIPLLRSQGDATCPYPEPDQSSPCPTFHFLKIYFNIILPSMPRSAKWFPSLRLLHQNPVCTSPFPHPCYMPSHLTLPDLITWKNIWYGVQIIKVLVTFVVNIYHNSAISLYQILQTINDIKILCSSFIPS